MKKTFLFLCALLAVIAAQAQFSFYTYNNTVIITGYTNYGGAITIPSAIDGLPVVGIQGSGFEDKGITSVVIPDTVTSVWAQVFSPNPTLTNITVATNNPAYSSAGGVLFDKSGATLIEYPPGLNGSYAIPGTVSNVADNAFAASYSLTAVTIPNSVTNFGATAFGYCFSLTNFTIPGSVTSIGPDAFANCYNLTSIVVAAQNTAFSSIGGVLFDKTGSTLIDFPAGLGGSYAVPNGCIIINTNAFYLCDALTNIALPPSVTTLDDGAFAYCDVTNITLDAGVIAISSSAFTGNNVLQAINVNPTNSNFSSLNGVVFNKNQTGLIQFPPGLGGTYAVPGSVTSIATSAFEDCLVANVLVPGNVTAIASLALQGCGSLTNVTMSNGVANIGFAAFADCSQLATVTIPASVTNLTPNLFAYSGLVSVYFQGNEPASDPSAFFGDAPTVYYSAGTSGWGPFFDGLTTVIVGEPNPHGALSTTILPAGAALAGAQWQVDGGVLQPGGATVVGLSVGQHTVSFTSITGWLAPSNQPVSVIANVTNTSTGTYTQMASPASDFTTVTNGNSITITGYVGPGGSVLTPSSINGFPVTAIADQAFSGIESLTSISIADSVTNIGDFAFSSCTGLAAATISENVTNIPVGIFEDCWNLTGVSLGSNVTVISDFAFASCSTLNDVPLPGGLTSIGEYAFFGTALTNVTLPAAITSIGDAAFVECFQLQAIGVNSSNPAFVSEAGVLYNKNLTGLIVYPDGKPGSSYVISNSVTTIGNNAFQFCNLFSVTLPQSVTSIGNSTFESCPNLTGVILPTNLLSIGDTAFGLCPNLTGITIPASVVSLGTIPFTGCQTMSAITVAAGNPSYSSVGGVLYNQAGTLLIEYPGGPTGTFAIPDGVRDIGSQAFAACQLTGLAIPTSVTNIEIYGIYNCSYLNTVTIADGLSSMGPAAFEDCYELTNIVLPATLTNIGDYAFAFSGSMQGAYFEGNAPPDDSTVFVGENQMTVYYLPGSTGWGPTFGTAPTRALPGIVSTANPTNGPAPLAVNFTAAAVNSSNSPVENWSWNFGDGATSVIRNPGHTYETAGNFLAALVETNNTGLPISGEAIAISVTSGFPSFSSLIMAGANLTLDCTGGVSGTTYIVLSASNVALPLNQWQPVATNIPNASGAFSITLTNAVTPANPRSFYILHSQ